MVFVIKVGGMFENDYGTHAHIPVTLRGNLKNRETEKQPNIRFLALSLRFCPFSLCNLNLRKRSSFPLTHDDHDTINTTTMNILPV